MSEPIENLFHERLAGHEADVPAGTWEHISGQLASAAAGASLRESLQGKFQAHEAHVAPSAWAHISGRLGHAGGGTAAGHGIRLGWIAAGAAAVVATAGLLLLNRQTNPAPPVLPEQHRTVQAMPQQPVAGAEGTQVEMPAMHQAPQPAAKHTAQTRAMAPRTVAGPAPGTAMQPPQREALPAPPVPATAAEPALASQTEGLVAATGTGPQTAGASSPAAAQETRPIAAPGIVQPAPEHSAKHDAAKAGTEPSAPDPAAAAADPFHRNMDSGIMIPNAFSPQGDGINDVLEIVAAGYERADVRVVSVQTGMLVFQTNDLANRWDGRLANGSNAEEGYYRCVVILTDKDGRQRVQSEVVRLFR